jgi:superfamily II DNA or RNA helicase
MVPPGLVAKWELEWKLFRENCVRTKKALRWVRDERAHTATDVFKLLDDPESTRARLIWLTTSCFSPYALRDGWIKLALVRYARSETRMDEDLKRRLYKWLGSLAMLGKHGLVEDQVERLMNSDPLKWKGPLVEWGILEEGDDDPVPVHLARHIQSTHLEDLVKVMRGDDIPWRRGASNERTNTARRAFSEACSNAYSGWLDSVKWRSPLLVLDEAHHAKNDGTKLAGLFRSPDTADMLDVKDRAPPRLADKFDRMLFLTATPFQLGHQELIRVLRSFASVRWGDASSPIGTRESFLDDLDVLETRLNDNRIAGKHLDRLWGTMTTLVASDHADLQTAAIEWWDRACADPERDDHKHIVEAVRQCRETKCMAERDEVAPARSLRTWVIRHNRPAFLPQSDGQPARPRRAHRTGQAIREPSADEPCPAPGLPLAGDDALPFLLAARAQSELAASESHARAFFAEGLCSSYEAFHHTREGRDGRDSDDDDRRIENAENAGKGPLTVVPIRWYEEQIAGLNIIPSRSAPRRERAQHPKLGAVVRSAVDLWSAGEKVLIFCFYRQTARALREHLREEVEAKIVQLAAAKLGLDPLEAAEQTRPVLESVARRLSDRGSPFHEELFGEEGLLQGPFANFPALKSRKDHILEIIAAYVRSPSFIARYFPLDDPEVREALLERNTRAAAVRSAAKALRRSLEERKDASSMTMLGRIDELLRFVTELTRVEAIKVAEADEAPQSILDDYIQSMAVYAEQGRAQEDDDEDARVVEREGTYRVQAVVRMVYGDTRPETRRRLMLAFNSPLFPEILVSSSVLGEGVDLHRFCRHVIHHDLCWNPSTLEQRTGRIDRIRCKAEATRRPIVVHEPFIAGSADEKMYRVVRDRERWFQIVMGQKFEFDEATTERLAARLPLPEALARTLVFDLRRSSS